MPNAGFPAMTCSPGLLSVQ